MLKFSHQKWNHYSHSREWIIIPTLTLAIPLAELISLVGYIFRFKNNFNS